MSNETVYDRIRSRAERERDSQLTEHQRRKELTRRFNPTSDLTERFGLNHTGSDVCPTCGQQRGGDAA
jgi:hypothetical protein